MAELIPVGGAEGAERPSDLAAQEVAVLSLHPNPRQPRTQFDEAALAELADSIRSSGLLQPLLVRPRTTGGFEIVAGERRYRAALRAGLTQVPVIARKLSDEETLALALIENLMREDIGPLETARAFRRLIDDYGWTQEELSQRVGKSRPAVANAMRLLELPAPIQESLQKGEITEGHARMLVGDAKERQLPEFRRRQTKVWQLIRSKGITVREAEHLMRTAAPAAAGALPARRTAPVSPDTEAVEERLRRALGTKVQLAGDEKRGRIIIEYFSPEELDGLLARLEGEPPVGSSPAPPRSARSSAPIEGLLRSRRPV